MNKSVVWQPRRGSKTLYGLTLLIIAAITWAYYTPIDVAVETRGIVRPHGEVVRVISDVGGRIARVSVQEGKPIRAGDVILQLQTREAVTKQNLLEARIHSAELHLRQLREVVGQLAEAEDRSLDHDQFTDRASRRLSELLLEQSRLRLRQAYRLHQEGLISNQAFLEANDAVDRAEAEHHRHTLDATAVKKAQVAARLRERELEISAKRAELLSLYEQLMQAQLDLDRLTITSPAGGMVSSMAALHAGEILTPGTAIAAIIPSDHRLVIEAWVSSSDRHWIRRGQPVRLQTERQAIDHADTFTGEVTSISPDARVTDSMAAYRVIVLPDVYSPPLQTGLSFRVHFITRREKLLWLMLDSVRRHFY